MQIKLTRTTKIVIILCAIVIVIGASVGVTYAVWSASSSGGVDIGAGSWYNPSEKYIIFEVTQEGNRFPLKANQTFDDIGISTKPRFEVYTEYMTLENGYNPNAIFLTSGSFSNVKMIGYVGNVGEITVPDTIDIENGTSGVVVSQIDINTEEFNAIRVVGTLQIGRNITSISNGSFSNCTILHELTFLGERQTIEIGDYAFYACHNMTSSNLIKGTNTLNVGEYTGYNPTTGTSFFN